MDEEQCKWFAERFDLDPSACEHDLVPDNWDCGPEVGFELGTTSAGPFAAYSCEPQY